MQILSDQQIQEIKADVNYGVTQLINCINTLLQENSYLKNQNQILKKGLEGAEQCKQIE